MRIFIVALTTALLATPAVGQMTGAGKPSERSAPPPPADKEQKKKDEKAFNDAVNRIPPAEKKYDPWGVVRDNGKR
jgi:hypothetical protein